MLARFDVFEEIFDGVVERLLGVGEAAGGVGEVGISCLLCCYWILGNEKNGFFVIDR
ncbi:hypothetical protein JCM12294_47700 [Desulfocicer niacini]